VQKNKFQAGTTTDNSDFAKQIFRCPVRIQENHWRQYKKYPGTGNPWKISYAMNQFTLLSYPPSVTSPKTAKSLTVSNPAQTLGVVDVSYELNHPAVINLGQGTDKFWDIGYNHGKKHPDGSADVVFFDGHVAAFTAKQTNGIVMNFKVVGP